MAIKIKGDTVISNEENLTLNGDTHQLDGNTIFGNNITVGGIADIGNNLTVDGIITATGNYVGNGVILNDGDIACTGTVHSYGGAPIAALIYADTAYSSGLLDFANDQPDIHHFDTTDYMNKPPIKLAEDIKFPVRGLYRFTIHYYMKEIGTNNEIDFKFYLKLNAANDASYLESAGNGIVLLHRHTAKEVVNWSNDETGSSTNIVNIDPTNLVLFDEYKETNLWIDIDDFRGIEWVKIKSLSIELIAPLESGSKYKH